MLSLCKDFSLQIQNLLELWAWCFLFFLEFEILCFSKNLAFLKPFLIYWLKISHVLHLFAPFKCLTVCMHVVSGPRLLCFLRFFSLLLWSAHFLKALLFKPLCPCHPFFICSFQIFQILFLDTRGVMQVICQNDSILFCICNNYLLNSCYVLSDFLGTFLLINSVI